MFGVALLATIAVGLAQRSGESLEDRVPESELVEEHAEQGETVLPWAVAVTVIAGAVAVAGPVLKRFPRIPGAAVTAVLIATALLASSGATWTVVSVGHSGAKATWHDVTDEDN